MGTPSGTITAQDINYELGRSTTASINLNDANIRTLAQVGGSGTQISMDNLRNKGALWGGWTTVVNSTSQVNTGSTATYLSAGSQMWWRWYIGDMFLNLPNRYVVIPATYYSDPYNNFGETGDLATTWGTGSTYPGTNLTTLSTYLSSYGGERHQFALLACEVSNSQQYLDFYHYNPANYQAYSQQFSNYVTTRMNIPEVYITAGIMPRYYRTGYAAGFSVNPGYTRAAITTGRTHSVVMGIGIANSTTATGFTSWSPSTFSRSHNNAINHFHRIRDQTTTQAYTTSTSSQAAYIIEHLWEYGPA